MKRLMLVPFLLAGAGAVLLLTGGSDSSAQSGPLLKVYWDTEFGGRCLEVTGDLLDLPKGVDEEGNEYDWNDQISSIIVVRGTWRLYEHGRANTELDETPLEELDLSEKAPVQGWSVLVSGSSQGPVEYPTPESAGFKNDRISSIELVSEENLPSWALFGPRLRTRK